MRIQHNIPALSAYRNYTRNVSMVNKNLEKLSSGYKINRAGDDAAGLAISEKMRIQISGLEQAQNNAKSGINLVQTAEGALTEVHDMLNRMYTLAEQSANGTYADEVDREQLQKEVDSLRTEINRIADATNYNGIDLLNGKLGLNEEAFKVGIGKAAAVGADGAALDAADYVPASTATAPTLHTEGETADGEAPAAIIDLGDLAIQTTTANQTMTVTVAGTDYTLTLATGNHEYSATDIAGLLATAMKKVQASTGLAGTNDAVLLGGAAFTPTAENGTVKLVYAGSKTDGTNWKQETDFTGNDTVAGTINDALGFEISITPGTGMTQKAGTDIVHKATTVAHAVGAQTGSKAGIDITMDTDFVKDGGSITIDGKKFTFQVGQNSKVAGGADVINLKDVEEGDADLLHKAADALSNKTVSGQDGRSWKIGVNADGTTIHIDQTAASDSGKALDDYDKLVGVLQFNGPASAAKNVGTTIEVTNNKVKEGDTLNIDGVSYVFTEDTTGKTDTTDTKYVQFTKNGTDAATNLQAKIGGTSEINSNVVTVRAATADDAAPAVLGKGLSLQIGDTAEDFNKMMVSVKDMHAISMGIGDIDISTQDGASAAMDAIKNATNYVSDVRGDLGALQNRLDHTINNLSVTQENITDAESTIRDVDIAKEMMAYTKNNILVQSAQAMLAQANQLPQGVLQLLG